METNEIFLFSNSLGSVTDKRIILNYKRGTEDLLVRQVASIRFQHYRNYFLSISSFLISLVGLIAMFVNLSDLDGAVVFVILVFVIFGLLSGIANWIGHYSILITSGGIDRKPIKVKCQRQNKDVNL